MSAAQSGEPEGDRRDGHSAHVGAAGRARRAPDRLLARASPPSGGVGTADPLGSDRSGRRTRRRRSSRGGRAARRPARPCRPSGNHGPCTTRRRRRRRQRSDLPRSLLDMADVERPSTPLWWYGIVAIAVVLAGLWLVSAVVGFLLGLVKLAVIVVLSIAVIGWIVEQEGGLAGLTRAPDVSRRSRTLPRRTRRSRARARSSPNRSTSEIASTAVCSASSYTAPATTSTERRPRRHAVRDAADDLALERLCVEETLTGHDEIRVLEQSSNSTSSATRSNPSINVPPTAAKAPARPPATPGTGEVAVRRRRARRRTPPRAVRAVVEAARTWARPRPSAAATRRRRRGTSSVRHRPPRGRRREVVATGRRPQARRARRPSWPSRRPRR